MRISVYRIDSVIGEGGMGVVYRAWDEAIGRPVALKCLHNNLCGDPEIRRRFAREARVLRDYRHPNVIQVFDFVEHDYLLAIAMELVEGPSLVQYLAKWRGRMPLAEIRAMFGGLLEAVGAGHRQGIIHRDLKPDNVLVSGGADDPRPKLVDFGIAKILEGTTYTMSGAFLGTCAYMSPEQVQRPTAADTRSDIYSLGVTLYQLCTGRLPFEGNHFSVMMAHVNQAPRLPSELRADLPIELTGLILDALAKDPDARPASCEVFHERLQRALGEVAGPPPRRAEPLPPVLENEHGPAMVLVPAGTFLMGRERRSVHIDAFYIDATPVTNEQFMRFVEVTHYRPSERGAERFLHHLPGRRIPRGKEHHPVVYVSWADAREYAAWAGKRLPSEAEWEKAARGTDGRKYPWGRTEPSPRNANYGNTRGDTAPVGSFPDGASPYGALDLAGNVWEWCSEYDDPEFYSDGPLHNPENLRPGPRPRLVMRGGSYMYGSRALRTYNRTSFEAHYRFGDGGFRCARSA
ncbi:MAG TPA: bifunctional serine/threonine-protein kinase/formylglycine-generating enzyme family protein [Polyangiaceae bacterium]|nr:bifunctional serine/threonine-protein kinase/formylglycine-generating enzyme family protein [Polyangiaceae bacterium]